VPEYVKSQVSGFMDVNLDLLSRNHEIITVALSHYYEQNGDLVADPDMMVRIDTKSETVEACRLGLGAITTWKGLRCNRGQRTKDRLKF
jgi:hypothetical protein